MTRFRVRTLWQHRSALRRYRSAVSLHSHTLYSKEMLAVIPRAVRKVTLQNWNLSKPEVPRTDLDVSRLWWTPPLSPRQAWQLERRQIETELDCEPFVSLTDHDSIEAPLMLRVLEASRDTPVSVEWTVPYGPTFFHLGIHNMDPKTARDVFSEMQVYRNQPGSARLRGLLEVLNSRRETLVVLNHPLWDEKGIGRGAHRRVAETLLAEFRGFIHALELNGFRTEEENRRVEQMAEAWHLPAISGGDRHGREPNANINLTNAGSFEEFVDEIRIDRYSDVLWMPQRQDGLPMRFLRAVCDAVRDDPNHGLGWSRWSDRVFYRCDDGVVLALTALWGDGRAPQLLSRLVGSVQFLDRLLSHPRLRAALRWNSAPEEEAGL